MPFKKETPQKGTQQKPPKQKCRKNGRTKNSVSAVVFTNSVPNLLYGGGGLQIVFAESPIKIGVSANLEKGKKGQKCEKGRVKICPRLSHTSVQVCCAT